MGRAYGRNFLDILNGYDTMKEYITNNYRTKDGVQYADVIPKINEQSLTLNFTMQGSSAADFTAKNKTFKEIMRVGNVTIQIPADGSDVYHLKCTGKSCTFARNIERTFAKIG